MKKLLTTEDVNELLTFAAPSAALNAAIETGLLWLLAENPQSGLEVARAMNIPPRRCSYWLQLLASIGILERTDGRFAPSALAKTAILETKSQASWEHLVVDERERTAGVQNLAGYIGEPGSIWAAQGLTGPRDYVEKMRLSYDRARDFTRMLYEIHQYLGDQLADYLDLAQVRRIMDVGGGSGVVSIALMRKYPGLTATVIDIENVCIAGREIADENLLSDRIEYLPANLIADELPSGYDMVMFCDCSIFLDSLFQRIWASLNPGGRLVFVNHFSPDEDTLPGKRVAWSFIDSLENPEFFIPTIAQVQRQLVQAGFHPLPGEKVLTDQRTVIQAVK